MASYKQSLVELISNDSNYDTIKKLLENGANPLKIDSQHRTSPLLLAIKLGSYENLQLLLSYTSIERIMLTTPTLLHYTVTHSSMECLKLLLDTIGNDEINNVDTQGRTPLFLTILKHNFDMTNYLLEHVRANPNISDINNTYPVHLAAKYGNIDLLYLLKYYGAEFNVVDNHGNTPLHYVSHCTAVDVLIMQGDVDPTKRNKRGDTAIMLAKRRGNESVVKKLSEMESYWLLQHSINSNNICTYYMTWFIWYFKNTFQQLGWKITVLIIILFIICSWSFSVYIHQSHPFQ